MKIGLITPNNLWFCPYVSIYTKILDRLNINYDIISWNRDGREKLPLQYNKPLKTHNRIYVLYAYMRYATHVKQILKKNSYDRLIIFTPQIGIFLATYLRSAYKNKYIFDYRDLSIEQSVCFKLFFNILLHNSFCNCISSPGFKKYLPSQFNYILSHNFDVKQAQQTIATPNTNYSDKSTTINILTIGGIRDYESNTEIIQALANNPKFQLSFVGKGPSAAALEDYVIENGIKNVDFEGYYKKEEEAEYIAKCTYLNIYYPRKPSHDSAISNRFYNSLIHKRPMIVTANTTQGDFVAKYNLGIVVENCESLEQQIYDYDKNNNLNEYIEQCNNLLKLFIEDYNIFESKVITFIDNK